MAEAIRQEQNVTTRTFSSGWFAVFLFALLLMLHMLAMSFGWYLNERSPIDIFYHLLGGACIAAATFHLLKTRGKTILGGFLLFFIAVGAAAMAGIGWELFEFVLDGFSRSYGGAFRAQGNMGDTMGDLFNNLVGASIFAIIYLKALQGPVNKTL